MTDNNLGHPVGCVCQDCDPPLNGGPLRAMLVFALVNIAIFMILLSTGHLHWS
jgi:hypothetical protein